MSTSCQLNPPHDVVLATQNLRIGYRRKTSPTWQFPHPLTLSARSARLIAMVGPNGSGKSTLLRTLAGLQPPLEGEVFVRQMPLASYSPIALARLRSYAFTHQDRPQWMLGSDWVAHGRFPHTGWLGSVSPQDQDLIRNALLAVNASYLAERPLTDCSDGEFQRLIIARCLCQNTPLSFLDEPLAHLDPPHKAEVIARLKDHVRTSGHTLIISIHDLDLAFRHADEIWVLGNNGAFTDGIPESVIDSPVLLEAFRGNQVAFNPHTLTFVSRPVREKPIRFTAPDSPNGLATRRLLQRLGYADVPGDPSTPELTLDECSPAPCWKLSLPGTPPRALQSLSDLATTLERLPS